MIKISPLALFFVYLGTPLILLMGSSLFLMNPPGMIFGSQAR